MADRLVTYWLIMRLNGGIVTLCNATIDSSSPPYTSDSHDPSICMIPLGVPPYIPISPFCLRRSSWFPSVWLALHSSEGARRLAVYWRLQHKISCHLGRFNIKHTWFLCLPSIHHGTATKITTACLLVLSLVFRSGIQSQSHLVKAHLGSPQSWCLCKPPTK